MKAPKPAPHGPKNAPPVPPAPKHVPHTGIKPKDQAAIADELQKLLADENLLLNATKGAHWNVQGIHFGQLHLFFEGQYDELAEITDQVAERIRQLGFPADSMLATFIEKSRLEEKPAGPDAKELLQGLLDMQESVIRSIRSCIDPIEDEHGDAGTADFLTGLMEQHEKMAWMIRAHL